MKNLKGSNQFKTRGINKKTKALFILIVGIILICLGIYLLRIVNDWYNTHFFEFKSPVEVQLNQPITIRERKPIIQKIVLDYPEIKTPLEHLICDTFGPMDCKIALSVAKAESGMRENAYHYNDNGTIDIGVFQVNQIHWAKAGCSPKELFDAEKNIACAYKIWKASGWSAWVAFTNNNYISKL